MHCRVAAVLLAATAALAAAGCTARGGGQLPPDGAAFTAPATTGFSLACDRGRLAVQLEYVEHGASVFGAGFTIHGQADTLPEGLEAALCADAPDPGAVLVFLGAFRVTGAAPAGLPPTCVGSGACRFEVTVEDRDRSRGPSRGDGFGIRLSGDTAVREELDAGSVFYARSGTLDRGNLTVDG